MNDPDLYLVRVWHPGGTFRASVRRLEEEQPRLFLDPAELAHYLATARADGSPRSKTPAAPPATTAASGA